MSFNIRNNKIKLTSGNTYTYSNSNSMNTNTQYEELDYSENFIDGTKFTVLKNSCYDKISYDGEVFYDENKVSKSGRIEDYTDFQNCLTGQLNVNDLNKMLVLNDYNYNGKTIYELYQSGAYEDTDKLVKLINLGFGDLKVMEVVDGEAGFDAIVFQDVDGNYLLSFPCTDVSEESGADIIYDVEHILPVDLQNMSESFNLPVSATHKNQKKQASELAEKYYKLAKEEGVTINVTGYSLGGSLAEYVYLDLCKKYLSYKDDEVMGELIVYEAFHNDLSNQQIEFLKEMHKKGKINIYSAEGSTVSSYYNHEDLKDITKFIYVDYINEMRNSLTYDSGFANEFIHKKIEWDYLNFDVYSALKSIYTDEEIKNLAFLINNAKLLYSGAAHDAANPLEYADISFDENGNVRDVVYLEDENGNLYEYKVKSPSFQEITKEIFGTDLSKEIKLLNEFSHLCDDITKTYNDFDGLNPKELYEGLINVFNSFDRNSDGWSIAFTILNSGAVDVHKRKILYDIKNRYGDKGFWIFNVGNAIDLGLGIYDGFNSAVDWANDAWNTGVDWASDAWNTGVDWVSDAWNVTTDFASDAWNATTDFVGDAWNATTDFAGAAWNATTDFVGDAWDAGTEAVGDFVSFINPFD